MLGVFSWRRVVLVCALLMPLPASAQQLFVTSYNTNQIKKYDPSTGSFLGNIGGAELVNPLSIAASPGGDLFVIGDGDTRVLRYDGSTGAYKGVFATGLSLPEDFALWTEWRSPVSNPAP